MSELSRVKDAIWNYLNTEEAKGTPLDEYSSDFIFYYGPFMVMTPEYQGVVQRLMKTDWALRHMKLCWDTYCQLGKSISVKEAKEALLSNAKQSQKTYGTLPAFEAVCGAWMKNIHDYTYKEHLMESAMLNMAPIVPYDVTLRKQEASEFFANHARIYQEPNPGVNHAKYFFNCISDPMVADSSLLGTLLEQNVYQILEISGWATTVCPYYEELNSPESLPALFDRFVTAAEGGKSVTRQSLLYYFLALAKLHHYPQSLILKYLMTMDDFSNVDVSTADIVQEFMSAGDTVEDMQPYIAMEAIQQMEHITQSETERLLQQDAKTDPYRNADRLYDLDKLIGYLYVHREYVCTDYANHFFVNSVRGQKLTNFNYMKDSIMMVEIDDSYLVIPITDMAADRKIKALVMNKDNEISVQDTFDFSGTKNTASIKALLD